LSYRGQPKGSYGNSRRGRWPWSGPKKPKPKENQENVIYVRDSEDKPKQPIPDTFHWQEKLVPEGTKVILSRSTSLTVPGGKTLLANDLDRQHEIAFQICQLAAQNQKLSIEVLLPDNVTVKKFKIIHSEDQLPSDKAVSFSDMVYVGNLRNQLRANGFTLIAV
jgi:hypothetical protein